MLCEGPRHVQAEKFGMYELVVLLLELVVLLVCMYELNSLAKKQGVVPISRGCIYVGLREFGGPRGWLAGLEGG